MNGLFSNENFLWGLIIFFVLLGYILVSVVEYIRGRDHRRLGFWFSRVGGGLYKNSISWPISLAGHLFILLSLATGIAIVMFVNDVTLQGALVCAWAIIILYITHKKCIY